MLSYCLNIYYKSGKLVALEGIFNEQEQKILRQLMDSYRAVTLKKQKGSYMFETLKCAYPPRPF